MSRRRALHHDSEEEDLEVDSSSEALSGGKQWCYHQCHSFPEEPSNPMACLGLPWHVGMVVFYSLLLYHGINIRTSNQHILDPQGKIPAMGGLFKYLTHINQWIQLVFFGLQLLTDLTPCRYKKKLQKTSSFLFTTLAFPISALVAVTFWGIYAIDRKLVYPEVFDKFVPGYMNHFWHTTILLWVLCEIYLVFHEFPTTAMAACSAFVFGSVYIGWVVYIYVATNWWVYPFMRNLPPAAMALFFGSSMFLTLGLHLAGKVISYYRWGTTCFQNELKKD